MMLANELLKDAFERIRQDVHGAVEGLSQTELAWRAGKGANSIAWLVWHLTRTQDDHLSELAGKEQNWTKEGWVERFALPFSTDATGYGQTSSEAGRVQASAELLLGYFDAVHTQTISYLDRLHENDYAKVIDTRFNPPVTTAVRLISVINDCTQHAGQAAYVRGLLKNQSV